MTARSEAKAICLARALELAEQATQEPSPGRRGEIERLSASYFRAAGEDQSPDAKARA